MTTDAGTRATVERVVAAVVAVLEDRTYDEHAADESIWAETRDHLRIAVAEALAAQPSEGEPA